MHQALRRIFLVLLQQVVILVGTSLPLLLPSESRRFEVTQSKPRIYPIFSSDQKTISIVTNPKWHIQENIQIITFILFS